MNEPTFKRPEIKHFYTQMMIAFKRLCEGEELEEMERLIRRILHMLEENDEELEELTDLSPAEYADFLLTQHVIVAEHDAAFDAYEALIEESPLSKKEKDETIDEFGSALGFFTNFEIPLSAVEQRSVRELAEDKLAALARAKKAWLHFGWLIGSVAGLDLAHFVLLVESLFSFELFTKFTVREPIDYLSHVSFFLFGGLVLGSLSYGIQRIRREWVKFLALLPLVVLAIAGGEWLTAKLDALGITYVVYIAPWHFLVALALTSAALFWLVKVLVWDKQLLPIGSEDAEFFY